MGRSRVTAVGRVASVKDLLPIRSWLGSELVLLGSWQGRRPFQHWDPSAPFPSLPTFQGSPWLLGPHLAYLGSHQPLRSKPDSDQSKPTEIFDIC